MRHARYDRNPEWHEDQLPLLTLSVGLGFRKETIAGARGKDEVAREAVIEPGANKTARPNPQEPLRVGL